MLTKEKVRKTSKAISKEEVERKNDPERNDSSNNKKKSKQDRNQLFDLDGSLNVARGNTAVVDEETFEKLKQQEDELLVSPQLKQRLQSLKKDDANPNSKSTVRGVTMNDKQKHALRKRHERGRHPAVTAQLQRRIQQRLEAKVDTEAAIDILQSDPVGCLEAETDMERTTSLTQVQLKRDFLDEQTARHIFDLKLTEAAPYGITYDRSGRYSLLFGKSHSRAHIAILDNHSLAVSTEIHHHVPSPIRDACFLHNASLFAVAHRHTIAIYDHHAAGAQVHELEKQTDPMALQFLPYHWLLASIGRQGILHYQDTSTGQLVSTHLTKLGPCRVLQQNPSNAVLAAGHTNGTVTLWSPASQQFLVKMLCHKGAAITSAAVDATGQTLVTGGADRQVKIWDLRMFKLRHAYYTAAGIPTSLDISQRGLLAIGHAGHVTVWSRDALTTKVKDPYMHHLLPGCGPVDTVRFRPFEDVCGIGHQRGISSIVIPGAGEPTLDTSEYFTNPHQDVKQRQEAEVRALLDKLSPDMIGLDPDQIGGIEESDPHLRLERMQDLQEQANGTTVVKKTKNKKRGRSKIQSQLRRKRANVIDQSTIKLREAREKEKAALAAERQARALGEATTSASAKEQVPAALKRFF